MGDWFGDWVATWFGAVDTGGGGGGGGTGGGAGGGPGTYPLPPGLTSQQKKAYAALVACAPCCGSGSNSSGNIICDGLCNGVAVSATLTLSVTEVADILGFPMPTGDITIIYSTSEVVERNLDQSEQPCIESASSFPGWFSDEIFLGTDIDACDIYVRYWYDACSGLLQAVVRGCNADCPDNNPPITNSILGTLAIVDCSPYYADISDSPTLVASVA